MFFHFFYFFYSIDLFRTSSVLSIDYILTGGDDGGGGGEKEGSGDHFPSVNPEILVQSDLTGAARISQRSRRIDAWIVAGISFRTTQHSIDPDWNLRCSSTARAKQEAVGRGVGRSEDQKKNERDFRWAATCAASQSPSPAVSACTADVSKVVPHL